MGITSSRDSTVTSRIESGETEKKTAGFPAGVGFTPVPNPLLASLLEEINDLGELKVTLRAIWMLHRKPGFPKSVSAGELCSDRTVAVMLGAAGKMLDDQVRAKLEAAVLRGTLMRSGSQGEATYCLNTAENRRAIAAPSREWPRQVTSGETWSDLETAKPLASVFSFYEENIGPLTPVTVGRIQQALETRTEAQVIEAVRAAVDANVRNWNYIAAVLRSIEDKGRTDGKPARGPEAARSDEFIRRYVEKQRARGNR